MSNGLEIQIDGREIVEAIRKLPMFDKVVKKWVNWATEINISWAHRFLANYPPPPAGSTYRRTGTLGRTWQSEIRATTSHVRAILANPTVYAPYVQDEDSQAMVHRGRWPTIQMLLRAPVSIFRKRYEEALELVAFTMFQILSS